MSVVPPEPLAKALERGLCKYLHLSMQVTVPPSAGGTPVVYINLPDEELTGIKVEMPAVNIMRVQVAPPLKDYVWRTFALAWGEISPAGITRDVIVTHGQLGMALHDDPWIHSLVDYVYPHSLTLIKGNPELLVIENRTTQAQTMDVTIHIMSFHTREDWEAYQRMLRSEERTADALEFLSSLWKSLKEKVESFIDRIVSVSVRRDRN